MLRKRIIRCLAAVLLIVLLAFTGISNWVNEASLPRVQTRTVEKEVGRLLDGYSLWETLAWVPRECVFPGNRENTVCVYRIGRRIGLFTELEYYADEVEIPVLDEREDAVLVEDLYLSYFETLICEANQSLIDGQTVVWLNPDS